MIVVALDGNVWNFLFDRNLDLAVELPANEFCFIQTREAEFELSTGKPDLDAFIKKTMNRSNVRTDYLFGFADSSEPASEQRYGGFNVGRFASPEEIAFLAQHKTPEIERPTKLRKHEADIALAARSFGSVVVTLDRKSAPLRDGPKAVALCI
jgi:hypothetical protein